MFPSLLAVRVARGYAACDGGGRWRVYGTRVAGGVGGRRVEAVLGRRLAEGFESGPTGLMPEQKLVVPMCPRRENGTCGEATGSVRRRIVRQTCAGRAVWYG